jgi:hypothetical protein
MLKVDRYICRQVGSCEPDLLDLLVPKWRRCDLATEEKWGAWHNLTTRNHANLHFRCFFRDFTWLHQVFLSKNDQTKDALQIAMCVRFERIQ